MLSLWPCPSQPILLMWVPAFLLDPTVALSVASELRPPGHHVGGKLMHSSFLPSPLISLWPAGSPMDVWLRPSLSVGELLLFTPPAPCSILLPAQVRQAHNAHFTRILLHSPLPGHRDNNSSPPWQFWVLVNTRKKGCEPLSGLALKTSVQIFCTCFLAFYTNYHKPGGLIE